ncbi:hypothetical protein BT69DRAFT_1295680 [Atractiella rhizophila]|nr:hypothetical protein BT69DRAFT_1295680 [Atractiella rhizophila]
MAVMNGTVVINGELTVDSDDEMEMFPKAKSKNTQLQRSAISSSCLLEKCMTTQLDSEDDATRLAISSKLLHLNQELLEPDIKPPSPPFWNFTKSNQCPSSTNIDVEAQPLRFLQQQGLQFRVPYPLPKTNLCNVPLCKNMLGKWSIDENAVKKVFTDINDGKVPDVDQSVEMINRRVFMPMTWLEEKMDWIYLSGTYNVSGFWRVEYHSLPPVLWLFFLNLLDFHAYQCLPPTVKLQEDGIHCCGVRQCQYNLSDLAFDILTPEIRWIMAT